MSHKVKASLQNVHLDFFVVVVVVMFCFLFPLDGVVQLQQSQYLHYRCWFQNQRQVEDHQTTQCLESFGYDHTIVMRHHIR
jgi:hypothetical protein